MFEKIFAFFKKDTKNNKETHIEQNVFPIIRTAAYLNCRKGPGPIYEVVTIYHPNQIMETFNEQDGWYKVKDGWINKVYTEEVK